MTKNFWQIQRGLNHIYNTTKFCGNCGKSKPILKTIDWTCFCGTVNKTKFCTNCGKTEQESEEARLKFEEEARIVEEERRKTEKEIRFEELRRKVGAKEAFDAYFRDLDIQIKQEKARRNKNS